MPKVKLALRTIAYKVTAWVGQCGHLVPKCVHLLGTLPMVASLVRSKPHCDNSIPGGSSTSARLCPQCFYVKNGAQASGGGVFRVHPNIQRHLLPLS